MMIRYATLRFFILLCLPMFLLSNTEVIVDLNDGKKTTLYTGSYALVIGVSDYTTEWPDLEGVKEDTQAVKEALEKQKFHVTTVLDPNDTELSAAFEDFIQKYGSTYENRLLFYFAGHGYTLKPKYGGDHLGYIIPTNAPHPLKKPGEFKNRALSLQRIEEYALNIDAKHAIFLFDSCFSGSIFSVTRALPENISYKTSKPVRMFISSGTENEKVPDKSIFRRQFISALEGEGDLNKDGYITGSELSSFLQDSVVNYSKNAQHPQYGKIRNPNLDKGDFIFLSSAATVETTPQTIAPQSGMISVTRGLDENSSEAEEVTLDENENWGMPKGVATDGEEATWALVKDSVNKLELKSFANHFPNGKYHTIALQTIKDIENNNTASRAWNPCTRWPCSSSCNNPFKSRKCYDRRRVYKLPNKQTTGRYVPPKRQLKHLPPKRKRPKCQPGVYYAIACEPIRLQPTGFGYKPVTYTPPKKQYKLSQTAPIKTIDFSKYYKWNLNTRKTKNGTLKYWTNTGSSNSSQNYYNNLNKRTNYYTPRYVHNVPIMQQHKLNRVYTPPGKNYYYNRNTYYRNRYHTTSRYNFNKRYSYPRRYRGLGDKEISMQEVEKKFWKQLEGSKAPEDFNLFLNTFPKGQYALAANIMLSRTLDDVWIDLKKIDEKADLIADERDKAKLAQEQAKKTLSFAEMKQQEAEAFEAFKKGETTPKEETQEVQEEEPVHPYEEILTELMEQLEAYAKIRNEIAQAGYDGVKDDESLENDIQNGFKQLMVLSDVIHLMNKYQYALTLQEDKSVTNEWKLDDAYYMKKLSTEALKANDEKTRGFLGDLLLILAEGFVAKMQR